MQRRRRFANFASISGGAEVVLPEPTVQNLDSCTCGGPGGWYGHERHCGEVEPVPHIGTKTEPILWTDAEDLEF